jgi:hypothetical protein
LAQRLHPITGKPLVQNEDGSFSTEETITIEQDGRWYNIPTIVNGERVGADKAIELFNAGSNQHVGEYQSQIEAEAYAKERSARLGRHIPPVPSINDTYYDQGAENAAEFDARVKEAEAQDSYTWGQFGTDLWDDNTTVNLARGFAAPGFVDDPHYTRDLQDKDFELVQQALPEEWWPDFHNIGSREEFQYRFAQAAARNKAQQRYVSQGWLGFSAKLLTEVIDPTNAAIGFGVAAPAFRIAKASKTFMEAGQIARRGLQAGVGAGVGVASVGAYDASGGHPADAEYIYAAGLGALIGGAFGPLARNPSTADIAARTAAIGQSAMNKASRQFRKAAEPTPEPRTTPIADVPETVAPDAEVAQMSDAIPAAPPVSDEAARAQQRSTFLEEQAARAEDAGAPEAAAVLRTKAAEFAAKAKPEPVYRPLKQLEDRPADLKNDRYVARYEGGDGHDYMIRATADGDALSGPYEVLKLGKPGQAGAFIARDIEGMKPSAIAERYIPREVDEAATAQGLPRETPADADAINARLDEIDAELEQARQANDDGTLDAVIADLEQEAVDLEAQLNELEAPDGTPADLTSEELQRRILNIRETIGESLDEETAQEIDDFVAGVQEQIAARNAPADAGAAANTGPIEPTFLDKYPGFRALREEDVAYPARPLGLPRTSIAGVWGNTPNAATRLINQHLYNDAVGLADGTTAARSADLTKERLLYQFADMAYRGRRESYRDWYEAMGYSWLRSKTTGIEYRRLLSDAIESPNELPDILRTAYADRLRDGSLTQEALDRAAKALLADAAGPREAFATVLEKAVEAGIPGAADVATALKAGTYLPHAFNWRQIQALTKRGGPLGGNGLLALVYKAIRTAQPTLNDHYLNRLAEGYTQNVMTRAYKGGADEWTIAMRTGDRKRFVQLLREDVHNITEEEIDHIMQHIWDVQPEGSGMGNLKRRVLLDVNAEHNGIAFKHILERDFDLLFNPYANRFAGRIALANMQIKSPVKPRFKLVETRHPDGTSTFERVPDGFTGGDVIFEGVKKDSDIDTLYDIVRSYGAEQTAKGGPDMRLVNDRDLQRMKWGIERILGYPDPNEHTNVANFLRAFRDFQHSRLMWQGGVAQLGETGGLIGTFGLRATLSQAPGLRSIMNAAARDPVAAKAYRQEARALVGGAVNDHHNLTLPGDTADGLPFRVEGRNHYDAIRAHLSLGPKITNKFALQTGIQKVQEEMTVKIMAQKIADAGWKLAKGKALTESERKRFAQLTLGEDDIKSIYQQLKDHATLVENPDEPGKIASLNLHQWTDINARTALEEGLYRSARKMIQSTNLGNMAVWMRTPVAKTIFQFRQFTFTAWENALLYNLNMRDFPAMLSFMWSMGVAGTVRGAQVYATAALMDDRQARKYRERNLTTEALVKGAFQRTAHASFIPALADTAWLAVGQKPLFDARFSQQPTDFITGSVPFTYANTVFRGVGGMADAALTGRRLSQAELKAFQQMWPMATFLPWSAAWSHMISDFPERAPKMD